MRLADERVTTDEVKHWKGLHLLHFRSSSCSQKVRILLAEKQIPWVSRPVNLARQEHTKPWFLGINPRGVVPVLVHDGVVHVESNDIMEYLDEHVPSRVAPFFPRSEHERQIARESLALEDGLHHALRTITMGFVFPRAIAKKPRRALDDYEQGGAPDEKRAAEVAWWRAFGRDGVPREQAVAASDAFRAAFDRLEERLAQHPWLLGDRISVLEIAWFISVRRLALAGYPLDRHSRLRDHYRALSRRPAFAREVRAGAAIDAFLVGYRLYRRLTRTTLADVLAA